MADQRTLSYGFGRRIALPYDEALARVRDALGAEGFGVLTEIDVSATMKQKLDIDFRPYVILGACNPKLAHRALSAEIDLGLLLPCNVIVYEAEDGGSVVEAMDPEAVMAMIDSAPLREVAAEVKARLQRAIESLAP